MLVSVRDVTEQRLAERDAASDLIRRADAALYADKAERAAA